MVCYEVFKYANPESLKSISPLDVEMYVRNFNVFERGYIDDNVIIYHKKGSRKDQIIIPRSQEFQDYTLSLSDAIGAIADYQNVSIKQLVNIFELKYSIDIVKYAMIGEGAVDGTLPLEDGSKLYSGAKKTLLASALSAESPNKYYEKISNQNTNELVRQCRIGQTEVGSYSVPLYCPIYTKEKKKIRFLKWADDPNETFTRKVTINLMKSTSHIADYIEKDKADQLINPEKDDMVISYNFCEAITQMKPSKNLELKITAEWLVSPPSKDIPRSTILPRDYFKEIGKVAKELKPDTESEVLDFYGHIHQLTDKDKIGSGKNRDGSIGITILRGDAHVFAQMDLNEKNYEKASNAHTRKKMVRVKGVLKKTGKQYSIIDIEEFGIVKDADSLIEVEE